MEAENEVKALGEILFAIDKHAKRDFKMDICYYMKYICMHVCLCMLSYICICAC